MKRSYTSMLSGSLVLAMAVALPAAAQRTEGQSPQDIKSQDASTLTFDCEHTENNNVLIFNGDLQMWPPNHKYQDLSVTAAGGGDDSSITLDTFVTHDEYVADYVPSDDDSEDEQTSNEEQGAGHTANDASPFARMGSSTDGSDVTNGHQVRSERSGRGDGRTYTISAMATFDGEDCSTSWTVEVPHDMRSHNAPAKEDKTD